MRTVDPQKHHARRQHILNAAAPLFAARGLDGTTTAEICRAAEISSGNLFHYFSSKRDIFAALLTKDADETRELVAKAEASDDPWTALITFVDHLAQPACQPLVPSLVLEAMLQAERDPELADLLDHESRHEHDVVTALVARAANAGQIEPPSGVAQTATWITSMIGGLYLASATDDSYDTATQLELLQLSIRQLLRPTR